MPIFDYKCRECGAKFEKIVSSKNEQTECPACQSDQTERLWSSFAVGSAKCAGSDSCANRHICSGDCGCRH